MPRRDRTDAQFLLTDVERQQLLRLSHGAGWRGWRCGRIELTETVRAVGLDDALSAALARWRSPHAVHDPRKVVLDLAVTLALGGDCLAYVAVLRAVPGRFGRRSRRSR
jgi:hypothetical protein